MKTHSILALIALVVVLAACQTAPTDIPTDLEPAEYFQRAQEAFDANRYETALTYYEAVIERFPDDSATQVSAKYEIAFINYKMGNEERATELFNELIARYNDAEGQELPQWPKVLAEKVLEKMQSDEDPTTAG